MSQGDIHVQLLNPWLYQGLLRFCGGPHRVKVLRPGQPNQWVVVWNRLEDGTLRPSRKPCQRGEEYSVNCPQCGDRRGRLLINHCFGVPDEQGDDLRLWMVNCFHRGCFETRRMQQYLYDQLYVYGGPVCRVPEPTLSEGEVSALQPLDQLEAEVIPLDELSLRPPLFDDHPALIYIQQRGFDRLKLSRLYGVGWCQCSLRWPQLSGRIFIPLTLDGKLYGFQGRLPYDPPRRKRWLVKYWNMPNLPKERLLYGIDLAQRYQFIVLCEGVFDVWSVGPCGVALLGKKVSFAQMELLCRKGRDGFHAILLLDPDQSADEMARGRVHHLHEARQFLSSVLGAARVHTVWLPSGTDAGSLQTVEIWQHILKQLAYVEPVLLCDLENLARHCQEWSGRFALRSG